MIAVERSSHDQNDDRWLACGLFAPEGRPYKLMGFIPHQLMDDRSLKDAPPSGYDLEGYDWCIEQWGTKWNAYDATLEQMLDGVRFIFRTAWTPPLPIILELARRFPSVSFSLEYSFDDNVDTVVVDFATN